MGHRSWFTYIESKQEWSDFLTSIKEQHGQRVFGACGIDYVLSVEREGPFPLGCVAIAWSGQGDRAIRQLPFYLRQQTRLLQNLLTRIPSFHDDPGPQRYGEIHSGRPAGDQADSIIEHLPETVTVRGVEKKEATFLERIYYQHYRDLLYYEVCGIRVGVAHDEQDQPFAKRLVEALSQCAPVAGVHQVAIPPGGSLAEGIADLSPRIDRWVSILSTASAPHDWASKETAIAAKHHFETGKTRVIPVVLDGFSTDSAIDDIVWVRAKGQDVRSETFVDLTRHITSESSLAPLTASRRASLGLASGPGTGRTRGDNQTWITHLASRHEVGALWTSVEGLRRRYDMMQIPDFDGRSPDRLMFESAFDVWWLKSMHVFNSPDPHFVCVWMCDGCSGLRALPYSLRQQTWHIADYEAATGRDPAHLGADLLESDGFDEAIGKLPEVLVVGGAPQTEQQFLEDLVSLDHPEPTMLETSGERIFVSHSSLDKKRVRAIARGLREHGLAPWLDEVEIQPGDSLTLKITDSVKTADYLVIALSTNTVASDWVRRELEIAAEQGSHGISEKIIVLRLDPIDIPPELQGRPLVDFTSQALETALEELSHLLHPSGSIREAIERIDPSAKINSNMPTDISKHLPELAKLPGFALDDQGELMVTDEEAATRSLADWHPRSGD